MEASLPSVIARAEERPVHTLQLGHVLAAQTIDAFVSDHVKQIYMIALIHSRFAGALFSPPIPRKGPPPSVFRTLCAYGPQWRRASV